MMSGCVWKVGLRFHAAGNEGYKQTLLPVVFSGSSVVSTVQQLVWFALWNGEPWGNWSFLAFEIVRGATHCWILWSWPIGGPLANSHKWRLPCPEPRLLLVCHLPVALCTFSPGSQYMLNSMISQKPYLRLLVNHFVPATLN